MMHFSSPGLAATAYPDPQASPVRARTRSWWLERLDALLLPRNPQDLPPQDLSRFRVISIAAGTLLLVNVALLRSVPEVLPPSLTLSLLVIPSFTALLHTATLVLLRRSRSPRLPAWLLCTTLAVGYITVNLAMGNPYGASHVASPLITLLAFFLLGARGGFAFATVMSLYAVALQPWILGSAQRWVPTGSARNMTAVGDAFAGLCNMGVWAMAWLNSRARDKAQVALVQTMKNVREGERKLSSLVESTEDIVCSLDAEGRLLTANAAMRRWFSLIFEQEPRLGEPLTRPSFLARHPEWPESFRKALHGERVRVELVYPLGDTSLALDFSLTSMADEGGRPAGVTIFGRDVTARRQAEARLSELHRTLLETSRKAGMAEIATGVLHNVGNTLNSVNVSATLMEERLRGSRVQGLVRATQMMQEKGPDLGMFLTRDERGRLLPEYLLSVSRQLAEEHATMLVELQSLTKNVDHIKSVVSMQQEHARFVGVLEEVSLPELLDDALRLHATSFEQLGIQVRREYTPVPPLQVDRHKLLQIVVNLLSNASHALLDSQRPDKQLTLRIAPQPEQRLRIEVADNGVGISAEHLPRIFSQGFTTKKNGHGFGLHTSALAVSELQGHLSCSSPGRGHGATFIIDLPLTPEQARA
ncbi:ATP-binding protein [Hyalangium sp.]|uniref:ATP-binding protein n=1 Tax=Hyalangium sp. TaxID=2028555 RepID=UPI002D688C1E|nr:ATP-binding protein [Hyalangium sp.]HYH96654.1 ATP-binding protein [Hyalangium sp.]